MKKKFETNHIEQYFQVTNQIAPIISEEKVHQIINSSTAKARLKGKTTNLLKFTIMTTLFAIIISAVLLWTDDSEKILKNIEQNSNRALQAIDSEPLQKREGIDAVDLNERTNVYTQNYHHAQLVEAKDHNPKNDFKESNQFKTSNYAIYKNLKNASCDFEMFLFDKDVFELNDKNNTIWLSIISNQSKSLVSGKYSFSDLNNGKHTPMSFGGQYYIDPNSILKIIDGTIIVDTSMVNHSFVYELILENHQKISGKYQPKPYDREGYDHSVEKPEKEYVYPEQILDSTMFIELSRKELENLGFKLKDGTIELRYLLNGGNFFTTYVDSRMAFGVRLCENNNQDNTTILAENINITMYDKDTLQPSGGIIPMLITVENGRGCVKQEIPENDLKALFSKRLNKDFKTLFPVIMKKNTFGIYPKEDVVYWFIPTEDFFNRLPKNISKELLAEYDYITAEDKSTIEKPVCKYFDECKNTLKVSGFKVFPNPANDKASISFTLPEAIDGRITLVDLTGYERQILKPQSSYTKGQHSIQVDLSSVPEGIYLLTLYSDKGVQTQRVIVAR